MANKGYFQIPADDVGRAKKFYQSLLGWQIEPDTTLEDKTLEWQNIITGEPEPGTMNEGVPGVNLTIVNSSTGGFIFILFWWFLLVTWIWESRTDNHLLSDGLMLSLARDTSPK